METLGGEKAAVIITHMGLNRDLSAGINGVYVSSLVLIF